MRRRDAQLANSFPTVAATDTPTAVPTATVVVVVAATAAVAMAAAVVVVTACLRLALVFASKIGVCIGVSCFLLRQRY